MPKRIQVKNKKETPKGAYYVGPGSDWENTFETVQEYEKDLLKYRKHSGDLVSFYTDLAIMREIQIEMRGKDIACTCTEGKECHGDILLEIANSEII